MLAQYNLGTDYRQSTTENDVMFSDTNGWEYTPGPKEIDIETYASDINYYINEYLMTINDFLDGSDAYGSLVSLKLLKTLGCSINESYASDTSSDCSTSRHSFLLNGQDWWTSSAVSDDSYAAWVVQSSGAIVSTQVFNGIAGIQPVIDVPKKYLTN